MRIKKTEAAVRRGLDPTVEPIGEYVHAIAKQAPRQPSHGLTQGYRI